MRTFIGGLTAGFVGWLLWLFTRKAPHRTEPARPAFMWLYPATDDRAWKKWAQDARRRTRK